MNEHKSNRIQLVSAIAVMTFILLCALWAMSRQLDKPLLDLHAFRQTQTAISTYYMAEDAGMFFDYITPVLGKPWSIPMELPIYQWIVARWHNLSGMGLDQCGKIISIAFWFACIWPIWKLIGALGQTTFQRCVSVTLIYSSPLYLYWGRSFMIESTGLFLCLGMVACIYVGYNQRKWSWLLTGIVFGTAASLCKATTWAIGIGVSELLILFASGSFPKRSDLGWLGLTNACMALPYIPLKLWLKHGDLSKGENLFAHMMLMSEDKSQSTWYYGTIAQKLDPSTWQHIGGHIAGQLLAPSVWVGGVLMGAILISGAICKPRCIRVMAIFLAGFAAGPLVFTNLYFEHNYYWFANSIWLLLALGTGLGAMDEKLRGKWQKLVPVTIALSLVVSGLFAWNKRFLPILENLPDKEKLSEAWIQPVQRLVPSGKTLVIIGQDWNPTALYYAGRKGIMLPVKSKDPFNDLQKCISKLDANESIGAVCVAQSILTPENQEALARAFKMWGVGLQGTPSPFGVLFIASSP